MNIKKSNFQIILPIVGRDDAEILKDCQNLSKLKVNTIEWRADCYNNYKDINRTLEISKKIKEILLDKDLIFTLRSKGQGGNGIFKQNYQEILIKNLLDNDIFSIYDIEFNSSKDFLKDMNTLIRDYNKLSLLSLHNLENTPDFMNIINTLEDMDKLNFNIIKYITWSNSYEDSLRILNATDEFRKKTDKRLIIMAMGDFGKMTRILSPLFGSFYTFSYYSKNSAKGQISYENMLKIYEEIL